MNDPLAGLPEPRLFRYPATCDRKDCNEPSRWRPVAVIRPPASLRYKGPPIRCEIRIGLCDAHRREELESGGTALLHFAAGPVRAAGKAVDLDQSHVEFIALDASSIENTVGGGEGS